MLLYAQYRDLLSFAYNLLVEAITRFIVIIYIGGQ